MVKSRIKLIAVSIVVVILGVSSFLTAHMAKKKNADNFSAEVSTITNLPYVLIGKYVDSISSKGLIVVQQNGEASVKNPEQIATIVADLKKMYGERIVFCADDTLDGILAKTELIVCKNNAGGTAKGSEDTYLKNVQRVLEDDDSDVNYVVDVHPLRDLSQEIFMRQDREGFEFGYLHLFLNP